MECNQCFTLNYKTPFRPFPSVLVTALRKFFNMFCLNMLHNFLLASLETRRKIIGREFYKSRCYNKKRMKFNYKARTKEGELQVKCGGGLREMARTCFRARSFVLSIEHVIENTVKSRLTQFLERVRTTDLMVFTRQFATLLASQVPLSDSLANLHKTNNECGIKTSYL